MSFVLRCDMIVTTEAWSTGLAPDEMGRAATEDRSRQLGEWASEDTSGNICA